VIFTAEAQRPPRKNKAGRAALGFTGDKIAGVTDGEPTRQAETPSRQAGVTG
jgi:hypothetical protein